MDSVYDGVSLQQGLGDCVIVASVLEQYCERLGLPTIKYHTHTALVPYLRDHPKIQTVDKSDGLVNLKWVSQMKDEGLYNLHTCQRFSIQLGFIADPSQTTKLYRGNLPLLNNPTNRIICINSLSKERFRRFISRENLKTIEASAKEKNYEVVYIGDHYTNESIKDIDKALGILENCSLFIGPVSFWYHVAECMNIKCLLFTGYMPPNKFSHFLNTTALESNRSCRHFCERLERKGIRESVGCKDYCFASYEISPRDIILTLSQLL
jgi:hypothetical protein